MPGGHWRLRLRRAAAWAVFALGAGVVGATAQVAEAQTPAATNTYYYAVPVTVGGGAPTTVTLSVEVISGTGNEEDTARLALTGGIDMTQSFTATVVGVRSTAETADAARLDERRAIDGMLFVTVTITDVCGLVGGLCPALQFSAWSDTSPTISVTGGGEGGESPVTINIINEILAAGATLTAADDEGVGAAHLAASVNHTAALDLLISMAAALATVQDTAGWTPAHFAAKGGAAAALTVLNDNADAGVTLNQPAGGGIYPADVAGSDADFRAAMTLLGATICFRDCQGGAYTPRSLTAALRVTQAAERIYLPGGDYGGALGVVSIGGGYLHGDADYALAFTYSGPMEVSLASEGGSVVARDLTTGATVMKARVRDDVTIYAKLGGGGGGGGSSEPMTVTTRVELPLTIAGNFFTPEFNGRVRTESSLVITVVPGQPVTVNNRNIGQQLQLAANRNAEVIETNNETSHAVGVSRQIPNAAGDYILTPYPAISGGGGGGGGAVNEETMATLIVNDLPDSETALWSGVAETAPVTLLFAVTALLAEDRITSDLTVVYGAAGYAGSFEYQGSGNNTLNITYDTVSANVSVTIAGGVASVYVSPRSSLNGVLETAFVTIRTAASAPQMVRAIAINVSSEYDADVFLIGGRDGAQNTTVGIGDPTTLYVSVVVSAHILRELDALGIVVMSSYGRARFTIRKTDERVTLAFASYPFADELDGPKNAQGAAQALILTSASGIPAFSVGATQYMANFASPVTPVILPNNRTILETIRPAGAGTNDDYVVTYAQSVTLSRASDKVHRASAGDLAAGNVNFAEVGSLPVSLYGHRADVLNGTIFVMGGTRVPGVVVSPARTVTTRVEFTYETSGIFAVDLDLRTSVSITITVAAGQTNVTVTRNIGAELAALQNNNRRAEVIATRTPGPNRNVGDDFQIPQNALNLTLAPYPALSGGTYNDNNLSVYWSADRGVTWQGYLAPFGKRIRSEMHAHKGALYVISGWDPQPGDSGVVLNDTSQDIWRMNGANSAGNSAGDWTKLGEHHAKHIVADHRAVSWNGDLFIPAGQALVPFVAAHRPANFLSGGGSDADRFHLANGRYIYANTYLRLLSGTEGAAGNASSWLIGAEHGVELATRIDSQNDTQSGVRQYAAVVHLGGLYVFGSRGDGTATERETVHYALNLSANGGLRADWTTCSYSPGTSLDGVPAGRAYMDAVSWNRYYYVFGTGNGRVYRRSALCTQAANVGAVPTLNKHDTQAVVIPKGTAPDHPFD